MCSSLAYSANVKLRKNEINSTILKRWNTFYNNNYLIVMNWTHWWIGHISELERHSEISFENYLSHLKPVITLQIWNVCVCVCSHLAFIFSVHLNESDGFIGEIDDQIGFCWARAVDFSMTGNYSERKNEPAKQWICNIKTHTPNTSIILLHWNGHLLPIRNGQFILKITLLSWIPKSQ